MIMQENQRVRLSKKLLKESLLYLLQKNNIHTISVREICDGAEINRTTFYKYYGSQYDLLKDMENDVLAEIDRYLSGDEKPSNYIEQITSILCYINKNIDLCRLMLSNNVDPDFPEKIIRLPRVRELVAMSMQKSSEAEMEYVFRFLIDGSFGFLKMWINKQSREDPEEIAALLNQLIMKVSSE